MKIGQAWWLDDILGIAAPLACFMKSAEMGEPDLNIYLDGIKQHLGNNPILKIADCVSAVMEPDALLGEMETVANTYSKAPGGTPTGLEYVLGSLPGMALTYVGQFFTPGIVREVARALQPYETSYKRVYKTTGTGVLSEGGKNGETQLTNFEDAQIRKITRGNPVLAALMTILPGTDKSTSYFG